MFVGRARELEALERALAAAQAGTRRDRARRRGGGHRQDSAGVRARDARPRRRIRGPARPLDRSRRHGAAVPAVRRGAAPARRASARGAARSCGCSRRRSRCSPNARPPRPCCWCWRICTGPTRRRSTWSSSSPTTSTSGASLLLATCRADEPASAERVRRLADGVRRSGSALVLELGPLDARGADGAAGGPRRRAAARGGDGRDRRPLGGQPVLRRGAARRRRRSSGELPRGLRDLLLQRVAGLDRRTQALLRLAAAAGRDVGLPAAARAGGAPGARRCASRCARAVEHGVLVADRATGSFRFRHALLAEAVYATILPGEREELHARLAEELARSGAAAAAELAPHWAAAGRSAEALAASVDGGARGGGRLRPRGGAARTSSARSRCGMPCRTPPSSVGLDLAELCAWAARARQPDGRRAARGRARRGERSSSSARATAARGAPARRGSAATCSRAAAATPVSPRSSARSSSCRRSRRRRSGRRRWRRSRTG